MKILTDTSVSSVRKYLMISPSLYPEYCAVNFSLKKFLVQSCDPQLHFSKTKQNNYERLIIILISAYILVN